MHIKDVIKNIDSYATDDWDLANKILYDMCQKHPSNTDTQSVLAKTFIIGRTYAVALERRRPSKKTESTAEKEFINDDFYTNGVVKVFGKLKLDDDIEVIKSWGHVDILALDNSKINCALQLHRKLSVAFTELTQLNKRSFASKYLHFHLPNIFFIYDSRAFEALKVFFRDLPDAKSKIRALTNGSVDVEYASFYMRCLGILQYLKTQNPDVNISPRHLDNLLIAIANQKLREG